VNVTLFGYPKTGKTTLFNLLAGAHIEVRAYDDGRREPNVRAVPLPDPRLDRIAAAYPEKRKVAAALDLTDLVGISFGEVKTSLFLAHLRQADGLVHVVRGFADPDIPPARGRVDPAADIRSMEEELVLADLVLADGRLERLEKDLKKMKDAEGEKEREVLLKLRPALESGRGLREVALAPAEEKLIRSFAFLTLKPLLHFINIGEKDLASIRKPEALFPGLADPAKTGDTCPRDMSPSGASSPAGAGRRLLAFCGRIEADLTELEAADRASFMAEYGLAELSAPLFAAAAAAFLDRVSFITVGKDEVRAWTVRRGATALEAAGAIHSDIAKGFVRAEVVASEDLLNHGTLHHAKEAGAIRLEGKDYVVRDGDVVYFRFAP
jgi:ribosome-binding ATPase YchF (GTP1/OBG family)